MSITALMALFASVSTTYELPSNLLSSLCYIESTHRVDAVRADDGGQDSLGICQLHLTTAQMMGFRGTVEQLMNPKYNIKYAAKYLQKQIKRYNGDVYKAISAYNMGTAKFSKSGKFLNQRYVDKVVAKWKS